MIRSRASAVGGDFGDYISTKVLNAGEAAVAGPDSDGKGLVAFVEENGDRLTQLCLYAIGPGEIKDCKLLTGVGVGVAEGQLPARQVLCFNPLVQGFKLGLLVFACDAAWYRFRCRIRFCRAV